MKLTIGAILILVGIVSLFKYPNFGRSVPESIGVLIVLVIILVLGILLIKSDKEYFEKKENYFKAHPSQIPESLDVDKSKLRIYRDNTIFRIHTAESGAIILTKENSRSQEDNKDDVYTITEIEGYGGTYWSYSSTSLDDCINFLETGKDCIEKDWMDRSFASWWLFARVVYIDKDTEKILIERIRQYKKNGLLEIAYSKRYQADFTDQSKYFADWLIKAGYAGFNLTNDILFPKPKKNLLFISELNIEIYFELFNEPISSCSISFKINKNETFQQLLDFIYPCIAKEVKPHSYEEEWVLLDLSSLLYLEKKHNETRSLASLGFNETQKFICKKITTPNILPTT